MTVMHATKWHVYPSSTTLAAGLADKVADLLGNAIAERGRALLAVSGGTTPVRFFQALSGKSLDWERVTVTLVDERIVPETSARSNAGLVKSNLLRDKAARATFVGLYRGLQDPARAAAAARGVIAGLALPLDATVLGMGNDGHTASYFPAAPNLAELFDPATGDCVLPVEAEAAVEPRLTLTLPVLASSRFVALLIEGGDKKAAFDAALSATTPPFKPIRTVFDRLHPPPPVYWAPE